MALVLGKTYYIKNVGTGTYLNVNGYDTVSNGRDVNTYAKEDCKAQKWVVRTHSFGKRVLTTINEAYGLNIYAGSGGNNCTMWPVSGNDNDALVEFEAFNSSRNLYRIKMITHTLYLTSTGDTNGATAKFASNQDNNSLWELVDASIPEAPPIPTTIKNQIFFVKNENTGMYLNIHGYDTVENTRNVNVYGKENCLAQKWIARETNGRDGKLFTSINSAFAINHVSESNPNCTMYTAQNNDADSVLEFEAYDSYRKLYRIKLNSNGKYLTVSDLGSGANVEWKENSLGYSLWKFETEDEVFPPLPPKAPIPSALENEVVYFKNFATGKVLNIHGIETVVNTSNVNVYEEENVQAQKWIVRKDGDAAKIFTALNDEYALNIHDSDNSGRNGVSDPCTMYKAAGNDKDSHVSIYAQNELENVYKIVIHEYQQYLTATGDENGSDVIWGAEQTDGTDMWIAMSPDYLFPPSKPIPDEIRNQTFFIKNSDTGMYLNVHGYDEVADTTNVNVYSVEDCLAQRWIAKDLNNENGKIYTAIDSAFALNCVSASNPNCTMYTADGNDTDSVVEIIKYDSTNNLYRIKLHSSGAYLGTKTRGSGANVEWISDISNTENCFASWEFVTEEEALKATTEVPDGIDEDIFHIKNTITGTYLNVSGIEEVKIGSDVNTYRAENVLAQKWFTKVVGNGAKIFTAIDARYALNIENVNGSIDCTMYPAEGNDGDSNIELISAGVNKYKIKLVSHNRYLTATGTTSGSRVFWSSEESEMDTWEFQTPDKVEFDVIDGISDMFTADSSLVTKVIPAHNFNFISNRAAQDSKIEKITIHHMDGNLSIETVGSMWQDKSYGVSSHYGINGTQVGQYVREADIAITDGDYNSHKRSVTIETANSTLAPNWEVSDASLETLIKLVADIARRNNLGELKLPVQNANGEWVEVEGTNITWHSMYDPTVCPGPYLLSKMQEIADGANAINEKYKDAIYIRSLNTDMYLTVIEEHVEFADKNDSIPTMWVLKDVVGESEKEIVAAHNNSLKLCAENSSLVLSELSVESNVKIRTDSDTTSRFEILIKGSNARNSLGSVAYLNRNKNIAEFDYKRTEIYEGISSLSTKYSEKISATCEARLKDKYFKIKKGDKFLTLINDGTGNVVFSETLEEDATQIWKVTENEIGVVIVSFLDEKRYIRLWDYDYSCFAGRITYIENTPEKVLAAASLQLKPIDLNIRESKYSIEAINYEKYLHYDDVENSLVWVNPNSISEIDYFEFIETDHTVVDGWLKMYFEPQNALECRSVEIPSREYRLHQARKPDEEDGFNYEYTRTNYWFSGEPHYDSSNDIYINKNGEKKTTFINRIAYKVITETIGVEPVVKPGVKGELVDENGFYWVAVGPNVINPEFKETDSAGGDLYAKGKLDIVVEREDKLYYIRCRVGDIKNHTYPNGIFQTWKAFQFPNLYKLGELYSAGSDYNGIVVCEFIAEGAIGSLDYSNKKDTLGQFSISGIEFYPY